MTTVRASGLTAANSPAILEPLGGGLGVAWLQHPPNSSNSSELPNSSMIWSFRKVHRQNRRQDVSISATLRTAMLDSKLTRYAIAQASGINQSVLSRFAHDQRGLSMENAERLAEVLGFQLACIKTHKQADYRTKGDAT